MISARLRKLMMFSALAVAAFAVLLALELWIDHLEVGASSLITDIEGLQKYLEHASTLSSDHRALEERASRLHLTEDPGTQTSVVMDVTADIAKRNRLHLMLLRRQMDATAAQPRSAPLSRTVYSIVLQGAYRSELSALNDLAEEPLVTHVETVSFERIDVNGSATSNVRMTFELAVYRMNRRDVGARPS